MRIYEELYILRPDTSEEVIEASVDLRTWQPLATNIATSATVEFTDAARNSFSQRFYRIRQTQP